MVLHLGKSVDVRYRLEVQASLVDTEAQLAILLWRQDDERGPLALRWFDHPFAQHRVDMVTYDLAFCRPLTIEHLPDETRPGLLLDAVFCSADRSEVTVSHLLMYRHHFKYSRSLRIVLDIRQFYLVRPVTLSLRIFFVILLARRDSFRLVHRVGPLSESTLVSSSFSQGTWAMLRASATWCATLGSGVRIANGLRRRTTINIPFGRMRSTGEKFATSNSKDLLRSISCTPFGRRTP